MQLTADPDWWRGAVIYQIYPRSYQDSNGDGVGDLNGIHDRLDYIAELGVDAIWISPFFKSPMKDFGYDVSDYRDIDPLFGDLAAFDKMINKAHKLGLRIMIDLVLSHTSDVHEWFKESRSNKDNAKSDWYVWADAKQDGSAPNNWLSIFGGPAWTWDTTRLQYYMHNFLSSQPDLNFHNDEVQQALIDVAKFWLDRGVDGFRLDTINFYFCDAKLRDNPPLPVEERNSEIAPAVNPYNYQDHVYDKSRPENLAFLEKLRSAMDLYPDTTAVGEVGDAQRGMQLLTDYTQGDSRVHMCYTFDFLSPAAPTASHVKNVLDQFQVAGEDSWICWAFSNHDVVRHASRWQADNEYSEDFLKVVASLLLSLRGSVCLYQGEELGLPEADLALEDLQDPYGIQFWPEFKGRDGCRTPMVWDSTSEHAGFSDTKPWLPVPDAHKSLAVDQQLNRNNSLLQHYREAISFRKSEPALIKGDLVDMQVNNSVFSFKRVLDNDEVYCAFNLGNVDSEVTLSTTKNAQIIPTSGYDCQIEKGKVKIPAHHAAFIRV